MATEDTSPSGQAWGLSGQQLQLSFAVSTTVRDVKEAVAVALRECASAGAEVMPTSKQQLKSLTQGIFLKDANSLAAHNIGDGAVLELSAKSRGGKR